jgi:hypothetical protein
MQARPISAGVTNWVRTRCARSARHRSLRTWVDDFRFVDPLEWQLGSAKIALAAIPERAFDSSAEKLRVAALLDRYAHGTGVGARPGVEMTPQIDAAFGALARERIAHHPLRNTLGVALRRGLALWFDSNTDYYPFAGPLTPWADVPAAQRGPRLAFMLLVWTYTLLAAAGMARLWCAPRRASGRCCWDRSWRCGWRCSRHSRTPNRATRSSSFRCSPRRARWPAYKCVPSGHAWRADRNVCSGIRWGSRTAGADCAPRTWPHCHVSAACSYHRVA